MKYAKLKAENECKINFWTDVWAGDESLKNRFPCNCSINKNGTIAEFHPDSGWQINLEGI